MRLSYFGTMSHSTTVYHKQTSLHFRYLDFTKTYLNTKAIISIKRLLSVHLMMLSEFAWSLFFLELLVVGLLVVVVVVLYFWHELSFIIISYFSPIQIVWSKLAFWKWSDIFLSSWKILINCKFNPRTQLTLSSCSSLTSSGGWTTGAAVLSQHFFSQSAIPEPYP